MRTDVHLQKKLLHTNFSFFQTLVVHFLCVQSNIPEDGRQHKIFYLCRAIQRGTCHLPCLHFSRTMERRIEEDNLSGYPKPSTFCKLMDGLHISDRPHHCESIGLSCSVIPRIRKEIQMKIRLNQFHRLMECRHNR